MSLKDNFTDHAKIAISNYILDEIEKFGLGSMLKTDQDALLYHVMATYINPNAVKNRHDWIQLLKVKPTRLNGIQETASVKFNRIEDSAVNWLTVSRQLKSHPPEVKDLESGSVVIYIDDAHVYRFLEWYLNKNGSSPDYQINKTQLVVKYQQYLSFLEKITTDVGLDTKKLNTWLKEDKSKWKINKTYNNTTSIIKDIKEKMTDTGIKEVTKELLEFLGTAIISYAKNKVS